jgi:hypothetical protein
MDLTRISFCVEGFPPERFVILRASAAFTAGGLPYSSLTGGDVSRWPLKQAEAFGRGRGA